MDFSQPSTALLRLPAGRAHRAAGHRLRLVRRMRDLGGLIFIDLRDREGIVQCVFDEADNKELFDLAFTVRSEYTLKIEGVVRQRSSINDKIPTGRIEILADSLEIYEKPTLRPLRSATRPRSTTPCG